MPLFRGERRGSAGSSSGRRSAARPRGEGRVAPGETAPAAFASAREDLRRFPENRAPTSSAASVGVPRFEAGVFVIVVGIPPSPPSTGMVVASPRRTRASSRKNRDATSAAAAPGDVPAPSTSTSAATPLSARPDPAFPDARRLPENRAPTSSAATVGVPRFGRRLRHRRRRHRRNPRRRLPGRFALLSRKSSAHEPGSERRRPAVELRGRFASLCGRFASLSGRRRRRRRPRRRPGRCALLSRKSRADDVGGGDERLARGFDVSTLVPEHARATRIFREGFRAFAAVSAAVAGASSTRINSGLERRRGSPRASTASSATVSVATVSVTTAFAASFPGRRCSANSPMRSHSLRRFLSVAANAGASSTSTNPSVGVAGPLVAVVTAARAFASSAFLSIVAPPPPPPTTRPMSPRAV